TAEQRKAFIKSSTGAGSGSMGSVIALPPARACQRDSSGTSPFRSIRSGGDAGTSLGLAPLPVFAIGVRPVEQDDLSSGIAWLNGGRFGYASFGPEPRHLPHHHVPDAAHRRVARLAAAHLHDV